MSTRSRPLNRRKFLTSAGTIAGFGLGSSWLNDRGNRAVASPDGDRLREKDKIRDVRAYIIEDKRTDDGQPVKKEDVWTNTTLISSPMSIYPEYHDDRGSWGKNVLGRDGMLKNVAIAEDARGKVGDDFDLMYDCWMSLDVPYTIELARMLEPVRIKWLEECLLPDDYDGLVDIRKAVKSCWLTTGEHEYTRYGFLELLKRRCVDVVQPDMTWCGGLTEAIKIAHLARSYNVHVVPHVSATYSYHFCAAQTNCPFSEFIIWGERGNRIEPVFRNLFRDEPMPENGRIKLPDKPGWGMTLARDALNLRRPFPV